MNISPAPQMMGSDDDAPASGPDVLAGTFNVDLVAGNLTTMSADYATSFGGVNDGPTPSPLQFEEVLREGDCFLRTPKVPFCESSCGSSALCVAEQECQAYPTPLDVGTVTLQGVAVSSGKNELTMTALPPSNKYQPKGEQLAYPPFAEGAEVTLVSSGDTLSPLRLTAAAPAPLIVSGPDPVLLEPDTDAELTWAAAADPLASTLQATFDISHHGGLKGELVCQTSDDGSLTVPAKLITGLINLGFSGFPVVHLERLSVAEAQTRVGIVRLVLRSAVNRDLAIPGLVSCDEVDSTEGCPAGQTCQQDLKCSESID